MFIIQQTFKSIYIKISFKNMSMHINLQIRSDQKTFFFIKFKVIQTTLASLFTRECKFMQLNQMS